MRMEFLPTTKQEIDALGWDRPDFILVSGDAYVDHPSFGPAVISRVLQSLGYKTALLLQPDWRQALSFIALGSPRYAFLVTSGNIDSMVNHYTAAKKHRSFDAYSPGGAVGMRPDRAAIVYANRLREVWGDVPIILGGIEASLRRFAHYDYWEDKVRRSILLDAQADLLVYGMGEHPIQQIAEGLAAGITLSDLTYVPGTAYVTESPEISESDRILPGYQEVAGDRFKYAKAFLAQYQEQDTLRGKRLVQPHGCSYVVQNPPAPPLSQSALDRIYSLPYTRRAHPMYDEAGGIPALTEVAFSITSARGCFGGCSFCALTFHQGRVVQGRSHASILTEAEGLTFDPEFKGYIHDVGGPTANFREAACQKQQHQGTCAFKQCLFPKPCVQLKVDHQDYVCLLRKLRALPRVKKVFIRSGIRYDYLMADPDDTAFREIVAHHVSGQLKVAPEHISDRVLEKMGKPGRLVYEAFAKRFSEYNKALHKEQYLVPYLMSSHPGSDLKASVELAEYLRDTGCRPEQVQDFYPTPGTLSTCMYYTGLDPRTMEPVYVPKSLKEKALQRALLQYTHPKNHALVLEALQRAGRPDLIGYGPKCLVRPPAKDRLGADRQRNRRGPEGKGAKGAAAAGAARGAKKRGKPERGRPLKEKK